MAKFRLVMAVLLLLGVVLPGMVWAWVGPSEVRRRKVLRLGSVFLLMGALGVAWGVYDFGFGSAAGEVETWGALFAFLGLVVGGPLFGVGWGLVALGRRMTLPRPPA